MNVWWREKPLTEPELKLFVALTKVHYESTFRDNPSSHAVLLAAQGSGNYFQAIAAALCTLGGRHGPLVDTYDLLAADNPGSVARRILDDSRRVPGWGNGFVKGKLDPILEPIDQLIQGYEYPVGERIYEVQLVMNHRGLFPNPSCYTAATAIALGIPRDCTPWLVLNARLAAWTQLFERTQDLL